MIRRHWSDQKEILLDALQLHVNACLALDEYEAARKDLELLQELIEPRARGPIGLLLATVLLRLERDSEACKVLIETLALPELKHDLRVELEVLLLKLRLQHGQEEEALPLIDQLLQLEENEQKEKVSANLHAVGALLSHRQRYQEAEKALRLSLASKADAQLQAQSGLLLAEILILHDRYKEAGDLLNDIRARNLQSGQAPGPELASLLAELNLHLKRPDQAFAAAEQCFAATTPGSLRALTRARWVMAKLLFEVEKDAKNALPYSIKCFVLADDPLYSPKAMEMAIAIYGHCNETDARTWNELNNATRFSCRPAKHRPGQRLN